MPTNKRTVLALLSALLVAAFAGCGSSRSLVVGEGSDRFFDETYTDWVSFADQLSIVSVVAEEEEPPPAEVLQRGEGYISRTVTLRVENSLKPGRFGITSQIKQGEAGRRPGTIVMPSGDRIELADGRNLIGRLSDCRIVVSDGNTSRHHAEIHRSGSGFVINDLGSTNGTFLNGERLTADRRINDGDIITVGSVSLRFEAS